MYNKQLKKIALLLIIGSFAVTSSAQTVSLLKIGENPYTINDKAALEVESTTRGFLPPRMTKQQRDAIPTTLPVGLQVWCTDCDGTTVPASGQLCVYMGTYWVPIKLVVPSSSLTTGKITDAAPLRPVRVSATSATIKGTLEEVTGNLPTETGIVWKEIINGDYASLPFLDALGAATAPVYKTQAALVTTAGATISATIPTLTSTTSNRMPYYFRTYAKTAAGIEYGNPIVFSCFTGAICDGTVPTTVVPVTSAVTSRTWMDRNLGAYQAATSATDYNSYGCLYQWGRGNDGHASVTWTSSTTATLSTTTTTLSTTDTPGNTSFITDLAAGDWRSPSNNSLWQGISGINNPCPLGYRIPTIAEFTAETAITNTATAYSSTFKLPSAGLRVQNGALLDTSSEGGYWSSNRDTKNATYFSLTSSRVYGQVGCPRIYGRSVRCIKN